MKPKSVLVLLTFLLCTYANAQITFQKTFGGNNYEASYSVETTTDGGYIILGRTNSFGAGSYDVYLIRTDANGDTLWTKTFGGTGGENVFDYGAVKQTTDGGFIILGQTASFGVSYNVYLIKTDASGDEMWAKTYGGSNDDRGYSIQQTADTGYIISGTTRSFGAGSYDVYLIKTNDIGNVLWTKTFGGTQEDDGQSVQQTFDGGYIIAGTTRSFGAGVDDIYLLKTNNIGDVLWTKTYGGTVSEHANSVQQTSDSGFIITGLTVSFGAGGSDLFLLKTDANGDTMWIKTYGGTGADVGNFVQQTTDGGYIVAGLTKNFGSVIGNTYLIKTNFLGDTIWTKTYGGTSLHEARCIRQTIDKGFIFTGRTLIAGPNNHDVYLIKTDSNGNSGCYQFNTSTIVNSATMSMSSGAIVDSGVSVTNPTSIVANTPTIDSVLCFFSNCSLTASITSFKSVSCIGGNDGSATVTPINGSTIFSYSWSPTGGSDSSATNLVAGTYIVTIIDILGCTASDTIVITQLPEFTVSITGDTTFCTNASTLLTASGAASYLWSTSDTTQSIAVSNAGVYSVQVIDTNGCQSSNSVSVSIIPLLSVNLGNDTSFCKNSPITLDAGTVAYNFLWSTGDTITSITINNAGEYWVKVGDECGEETDTINIKLLDNDFADVMLPNVFTPNNDGVNDIFHANGVETTSAGLIFNRWGQKVYEWNSPEGGWDGRKMNGAFASAGVYYYIIKYKSLCAANTEFTKHGFVTLIR